MAHAEGAAILILAAGASSRMEGEDKLTRLAGGEPLLRRVARRALATGALVTVALPPDAPLRQAALDGLPVTVLVVPDAPLGMSRAVVQGIAALGAGTAMGIMILPADMPDLTPDALSLMLDQFRAGPEFILQATSETGQPGHPVILPRAVWHEVPALTGDVGARAILKRHPDLLRQIALPGSMALTDLDTPADWQQWERANRA